MGDVRYMLTANDLNGKCADINALFVALARAAGIPRATPTGCAWPVATGLQKPGQGRRRHPRPALPRRVLRRQPRLGAVDPADVRKVMLEEPPGELPINNPGARGARDAVRRLGDELGGLQPRPRRGLAGSGLGPVPFLMYPNGETAAGRMDSLDPDSFRYRLTARQLPA